MKQRTERWHGWRGVAVGVVSLLSPALGLAETQVDPTMPPATIRTLLPEGTERQQPVLTLTGIKQDGKDSVAIINNTMLRIGEAYQGFTLVAVTGSRAMLRDRANATTTLSMNVVDYRQPVRQSDAITPADRRQRTVPKKPVQ